MVAARGNYNGQRDGGGFHLRCGMSKIKQESEKRRIAEGGGRRAEGRRDLHPRLVKSTEREHHLYMSCMPQSPYQNPFPGAHSTTFFVQNDSRLYVAKWTFMKELLMPTPICVRVCVRVCVCVRVVGRFVAYFLWLPPRDRDGDQSRSLNRALAWPGHRVFPSPRPAPSSYNTINCQVGGLAVKMQGHNSLSSPPTPNLATNPTLQPHHLWQKRKF